MNRHINRLRDRIESRGQAKQRRAQKYKHRHTPDPTKIEPVKLHFGSKGEYLCQLTTFIVLYARSFDTLHILSHDDTRLSLVAESQKTSKSFSDLFSDTVSLPFDPVHLDMLEKRLLEALSILHAKKISYPISIAQVRFLLEGAVPRLYLFYNKNARWASDDAPHTWQADQVARARCLFHAVKLLLRLHTSPEISTALSLEEQQVLETYTRDLSPPSHHIDLLVSTVVPMTTHLASEIMLNLIESLRPQKAFDFFVSLFGHSVPQPDPRGLSIDCIYELYQQQRLQACLRGDPGNDEAAATDLRNHMLHFSLTELATLISCRAEAAAMLEHVETKSWWLMAKRLTDASRRDDPWYGRIRSESSVSNLIPLVIRSLHVSE
ncbi:hypothetical protein GGR52DRAFT_537133 [Hypoxylon sp. FL1284]|nr:hypothetical protein GGR52DRAFT_537133 [Hypoxylon sp. FL1284]